MNKDLKWLAENVHEWRVMCEYACVYRHHHNSEPELYWSCVVEDCHKTGQYTRQQWQAARDELSEKPGWDEVVGEWIAQDEDGQWYSFDSQPLRSERCWHGNPCYRVGSGKVLGDWRDTLERRPENHSVELTEKVWRGPEDGLPPIGIACEMIHPGIQNYGWQKVTIKAYFDRRVVIEGSQLIWPDGFSITNLDTALKFRPIRSEEDKAVEEMMQISGKTGDLSRCICTNLYRAGYIKQENPE